jgi:hypothetical protein
VETVLCLRDHVDIPADYDYMWSWLAKSWRLPGAAVHFPPHAAAAVDPVLTVDALTRLITFWHHFGEHTAQEFPNPDGGYVVSSRYKPTGQPNYKHLTLSIGQWPVSIILKDIPVLATKYPYIAADVQAAGLTARQEEVYQVALARALFTQQARELAEPLAATSVLARNLAFLALHGPLFGEAHAALGSTPLLPPDDGP